MDTLPLPRPLVIVKAGDTRPDLAEAQGDFEHWIARGLGDSTLPLVVLDPRRGDTLPDPQAISGVVVTGSHAMVSHREAWAEEQSAPSREQWLRSEQEAEAKEKERAAQAQAQPAKPERRIVGETRSAGPVALSSDVPRDILIVVSKLKAYIRARSGMNTSDGAMDVLSDIVREIADQAIQKAAADGRKTVLDRDF